jgi:aromatic ring-opening dioxygenase catalytic subunit (LigB family)
VKKERYENFELVPDLPMGERVIEMFRNAGVNAEANPKFNFIHDTFLILIRMFAKRGGNIPVVIVSANSHFDPHFHAQIGSVLRPLRYENVLLIGSGGAVHNLYRNHWMQMVLYRDNFAMPHPPDAFALEFRQSVEDAITMNSGPALKRAVTRLMKNPRYREAHGTDEHFIPMCFVAGAAGGKEDEGTKNVMTAECWELVCMANTQFQLGNWD